MNKYELGEKNNEKDCMDIIGSVKADTFEDRAFGCILGAFVADSCGSHQEFIEEVVDDHDMD